MGSDDMLLRHYPRHSLGGEAMDSGGANEEAETEKKKTKEEDGNGTLMDCLVLFS
jgi:hypothetical protein